MKRLAFTALVSTVAYLVVDYMKFKTDVILRRSAGESDYERTHTKYKRL